MSMEYTSILTTEKVTGYHNQSLLLSSFSETEKWTRHGKMPARESQPFVIPQKRFKDNAVHEEEYRDTDHRSGNGPRMRDQHQRDPPQRLQSRIVSSTKIKSREEVLAEQRQDHSGRDRNKRMFGALLGTLHRFSQDETKLKEKEEKRAQIEAKLEEQALQEKVAVQKEKQQLIRDRKIKMQETKIQEIKKRRLEDLEEWEVKTKFLRNFIRTEAKPPIFYLPKIMNPITECRLEASKQIVDEMIVNKRKICLSELESCEEQNKRYWNLRLDTNDHDQNIGREKKDPPESLDDGRERLDPLEESMEDELKVLMKDENLNLKEDKAEAEAEEIKTHSSEVE